MHSPARHATRLPSFASGLSHGKLFRGKLALCMLPLGLLLISSGCFHLGPNSQGLPHQGPAAAWHQLHQEHLERSHYSRVIPEPYAGEPETVTRPARFHPVPTRNVFQSWNRPPSGAPYSDMELAPGEFDGFPNQPSYEAVPPDYQPVPAPGTPTDDRILSPESSPQNAEELPSPLNLEGMPTAGNSPSESVTHNRLIQYPYTLDTQSHVSDWVRGKEVPSASIEPVSAQQPLPEKPILKVPGRSAATRSDLQPFAPPVYVTQHVTADSNPEKVVGRVTTFGPGPTLANLVPPALKQKIADRSNGVPYYPPATTDHPIYRQTMPMVAIDGQDRQRSPVQIHSALRNRFLPDSRQWR